MLLLYDLQRGKYIGISLLTTVPPGQNYAHPVISLDIMATITALAGVRIPEDKPLDGVNLIPYLTGRNSGAPHRQLFWRKHEQDGISIRQGHLKLVADGQRKEKGYKLFDLFKDIEERQDLFEAQPEQARRLIEQCDLWDAELKETAFPTLMQDAWWER